MLPPSAWRCAGKVHAACAFSKKRDIQSDEDARSTDEMKRAQLGRSNARFIVDPTLAAMERMNLYCTAHPGSPSSVRRPQLTVRGQLWIALLGPSVEEGIIGIGPTVEAALRAFDAQYLSGLRPPGAAPLKRRRAGRSSKLTPA
jgi:hypothetical protein